MEKEEEESQDPGDAKELGWRLSLSWEGRPKSKEEKTVGSLIWTGRVFILASFVVMLGIEVSVLFGWLAVVMLLTYTLYVVVYRRAIRVRRTEAIFLAVIALALAVLYIWITVSRMLWG